ncbi:MAG: cytochrome c [Cytophagales bacterium]|nr:MAG: cytochrome c [Cytophagales bacterium]
MNIQKISLFSLILLTLASCGKDPNNPGLEYAPQMYVSKAYEPYVQVEGVKNKFNAFGINMRVPAPNTIARRNYKTQFSDSTGKMVSEDLMLYNIHPDSLLLAEKILKNPIPLTEAVLKDGEVLYNRFCEHCHGAAGDGKGKVADIYKGVTNYAGVTKNNGHIYHVITFGKGRMWPHGSQISPEERWKIVHYVNKLQGGPPVEEQAKEKDDKKKDAAETKDAATAKK